MLNDAMENNPQKAWTLIDELNRISIPTDNVEKINHQKWCGHFNGLLHSETNNIDQAHQTCVKNELDNYESHHRMGKLDYMINEEEISAAAKKLKNNKSSSYDMIKNEMIKSALPFLSKSITYTFNEILNTGMFPENWKEVMVIPLHKTGSQFDPNNYISITLSSCLGKLFCHVLNNRITSELEMSPFSKKSRQVFVKIIELLIIYLF